MQIIPCQVSILAQVPRAAIKQLMKYLIYPNLILGLGLSAQADLFPNGNFSAGNDGTWEEASGGGTYTFDYFNTGGNSDHYASIDHIANDGGFGIWVANGGDILTLASLGLTAGETYNFSQDMTLLGGSDIGGFKLDFFDGSDPAGSTGDLRIDMIGDGTTWETYTYPITIPAGVDGIKAVPLWGIGSVVGFDNIGFDPTPIVTLPIPNSDFENGSANWFELQLGSRANWSYPDTDGNPGGYGLIDNPSTDWAIWVANGGAPIDISTLGIDPEDEVTFQQDMRIFSGSAIGTLKIEFLDGNTFLGDSGEDRPTIIGDGSTWETYYFPVTIPADTTHIKIVPVGGLEASVGFDNISFSFDPPPTNPTPTESTGPVVVNGTMIQWTATDPGKVYQPQFSQNETEWSDLGAPISGNTVQQAFDPVGAPFYRVMVSDPSSSEETIVNGNLEEGDFGDPACPLNWGCVGSQEPTLIDTDSYGGTHSVRIAVQNDNTGAPNTSELQQNIFEAFGFVSPGETYNFSFQAKQISFGVSYVQRFRVQWLGVGGAEVPGPQPFNDFTGGDGTWQEVTLNGITAPFDAETALIQIFGATGAVSGEEAKGEVIIDEISMIPASSNPPTFITETTQVPGIGIQFPTIAGVTYQVEESEDLFEFLPLGAPFVGDGELAAIGQDDILDSRYYRVIRNVVIEE